jgi:hypothetical protein
MQAIVVGGTGQVGRNAVKASMSLKEYSMSKLGSSHHTSKSSSAEVLTCHSYRVRKTRP